jgi:subtilisin family serine protease
LGAIEDAIILGADSINLSLGSGNPGRSRSSTAEFQAIMESLADTGVVVSISAGNSGHWAEETYPGYLYADDVSMHTGGSPGSFTNSLGVASVNNAGFVTGMSPIIMVGDVGVFYYDDNDYQGGGTYGNKPFSTLAGDYEYVFLNNIGTPEQFAALGEGALEGKIAMCYRGETSFFEKANAAVAAGAIAVIVVNNVDENFGMNLTGYEYDAPAVSISLSSGEIFKVNPITGDLYYETNIVRSYDLKNWERGKRALLKPDFQHEVLSHPGIYEINASDVEFIELNGKVKAYSCGGNQLGAHDWFTCEYEGTMGELFKSFF